MSQISHCLVFKLPFDGFKVDHMYYLSNCPHNLDAVDSIRDFIRQQELLSLINKRGNGEISEEHFQAELKRRGFIK